MHRASKRILGVTPHRLHLTQKSRYYSIRVIKLQHHEHVACSAFLELRVHMYSDRAIRTWSRKTGTASATLGRYFLITSDRYDAVSTGKLLPHRLFGVPADLVIQASLSLLSVLGFTVKRQMSHGAVLCQNRSFIS